ITPSVAEQEGQQTETEATGAPQKHHYTLNQQVGSITLCFFLYGFLFVQRRGKHSKITPPFAYSKLCRCDPSTL
ncbi:hypothetical protein M2C24_28160, partial [Klebsiella pneumoniae]|nr:hypothetical protein [Klebsiella pneumoniae]